MKLTKLKDMIEQKIVSKRTLDEMYIDVGELVSLDEFNKRTNPEEKDYRERAVDRLLDMAVSFTSNFNLQATLVKKLIRVSCPNCGAEMKVTGGGGNSQILSDIFTCQSGCGVNISLSMPPNGIYVDREEAKKK
jgi:hypothetical protein